MGKILVTDDSSLMRAVLKNFIVSEGHEVIEAADGREAVEKFKTENPDVVFMDILMPNGVDGITASRDIKKINPNAKIVMVTSVKEEKEFEEAKSLGIKDYINKPFSKEEIIVALKNNL